MMVRTTHLGDRVRRAHPDALVVETLNTLNADRHRALNIHVVR